ncbi:MAG: glycosyltransferase [Prevotellaceae bacterium]|nr:glycosyltransferase [Prevotellaceae bacterium]
MNILIVINSRIPAERYGGTQRVMWYLGRELALLGHRVSYLARKGSRCDFGRVLFIDESAPLCRQIPDDIDVAHFNDTVPQGFSSKPYVVTYHGNKISEPISRNAVFVSANHAKRFGSKSFVHNGLDWNDYGKTDLSRPRTYFHFLGKAAWSVKNVRGAISMVDAMPCEQLYVLGGYRLNFKMGLRLTFSRRAHFKGMVGGEEKLRLLNGSKGLLFPVVWDEPFGLAVIESLYCGSPVFATPYGSLPELVTEEVGYLSGSRQDMMEHMAQAQDYSPSVCRDYAASLFNSRRMAESYLQCYEKVMSGAWLCEEAPRPLQPLCRYEFK